MRASTERCRGWLADPHPAEEADPAKAENIANLKRELMALQIGIEELERVLGDSGAT